MRESLLKLLGFVVALTLSTCVSAIGMGGINVVSALGQPLKAEIELVAVNKIEKTSLVVRLASPDAYKGAGLEYPYGNKFKFQIENRPNGELYLKVSSEQPVNDPFVSMLIELSWASGRLLREYTFLLDPPGYIAEQPKQTDVQAIAPAVQSAQPEVAAKPVEQSAPVAAIHEESQPAEKPVMAAPVRKTVVFPKEKSVSTGSITVHDGDTLNKIAMQNKPDEVSLERMLIALYRANIDQFDGKNMNRIRAGKILRMPDQGELMGVGQSDAVKEIRAQTADWNAYRQKLAAAAPVTSKPQDAKQVATGKIASSVADKAPVAKESAKEVLKLSKGEAPGDKAATGAAGKQPTAQDRKNAEHEDAIAKAKSVKEEQTRAALLEKNLKDMQRLAQLKAEAAALQKSSSAVPSVAAPSPVVAAASAVKPAPAVKPKPKVVVSEPSLVDQILGEPLYLAGGAAVLLGLGGIGFMLSRRKRGFTAATAEKKIESAGAIAGHITAPVAPSPESGDFTSAAAMKKAEESPKPDNVDPINEADLFLNFGRDAQAEEILKDALRNTPGDHRIHLKLLGIYANRKDVNSFSSIARQLKDSGDEEAWQQAAAMGLRLEPNNPMYGGGTIEDADSATTQTTVLNAPEDAGSMTQQMNTFSPDFVLDDTQTEQEASATDVDFDLGDAEKTTIMPAADMAAVQAESMDFDISSADFSIPEAGVQAEAKSEGLDDLVFDITSTDTPVPAAQPEAVKPSTEEPDEDGMAFTLDFPVEDMAAKPASSAQPADSGLAGISLNLDDAETPGEPVPGIKDEHWHEVATKLDLAKAYQEMGDAVGAREILEDVLREGDEGQREAAQSLLNQIG
ncbi:MAG: FimV family protein [Nitrosomonadales bacterium]|nr:FimV family protein [Nitrosomonadales bacterium]